VITHSIEIDRRPEDVFAYMDQLDRHGEWQSAIVRTRVETEGPVRVGTRVVDTRRFGSREQDVPYEITEYDPPRTTSFRGVAGPIRPVGTVRVDPLDDGSRSRVTLNMDLKGHGLGILLAPIARRQARTEVGQAQAKLKEILERGA
jgi:uncharacterized protein YndB with AHSA1/START domain